MKHWLSLILGVLTLAASAIIAAPRLSLPEETFDFGIVPQHANVTHVFWIKSTGTETLHITKVKPACGCTKAPLEKNVLPGGDSTRLEIIFGTGSFTNSVTKSTEIETDAVPPISNVHFKAFVVAQPEATYPIVIKPFKVDMSEIDEQVRPEMSFTLTNVSKLPVRPRLVASDARLITITLPDVVPAGQSAKGAIRLAKGAAGRELKTSFTIQLDDKSATRFTIPVKREIRVISSGAAGGQ